MAKYIAVWGSPSSGKTTFSTKLAQTIYDEYQSTVIVVYCNCETPVLPVIFPNHRAEDLLSLGTVLAKADITQESVISQIVTLKNRVNFGFLGFKDGDNKYTYPSFGEDKAKLFCEVLGTLADYIIIDCTSDLSDPLSLVAIKDADEVIRLASPDLKSITFFSSQLPLYSDPVYRLNAHIQGINVPDEDLFMPIEEVKSGIPDTRFVIPYSKEVKEQLLDGRLFRAVRDKKYRQKILAITEKVI